MFMSFNSKKKLAKSMYTIALSTLKQKRDHELGGRHFRSEFATMFRVATVVTGNEAQFGLTVWKLMFLLLKSTKTFSIFECESV